MASLSRYRFLSRTLRVATVAGGAVAALFVVAQVPLGKVAVLPHVPPRTWTWARHLASKAPGQHVIEAEAPTCCLNAAALRRWVERVVVGQGLCPWAAGALNSGTIAYVSLAEADVDAVTLRLLEHAELVAEAEPPGGAGASTLLVAPNCEELGDFGAYLEVCDWINAGLDEMGLRGQVQLAQFHPEFQFQASDDESIDPEMDAEDPADFVGRSPVPAFHFLREAEVAGALDERASALELRGNLPIGDTETDAESDRRDAAGRSVADRNMEHLRERGVEACRADVHACMREAAEAVETEIDSGDKIGVC